SHGFFDPGPIVTQFFSGSLGCHLCQRRRATAKTSPPNKPGSARTRSLGRSCRTETRRNRIRSPAPAPPPTEIFELSMRAILGEEEGEVGPARQMDSDLSRRRQCKNATQLPQITGMRKS